MWKHISRAWFSAMSCHELVALHSTRFFVMLLQGTSSIVSSQINMHTLWSKETLPPRGGFLFTMFPHQEPCVRGPPSKDLYQVLRRGSFYTRLLMREHVNRNPSRGRGFFRSICTRLIPWTEGANLSTLEIKSPGTESWYQLSSFWYVRAASWRLLGTPTVERTQNKIYLYWRKYDVPKQILLNQTARLFLYGTGYIFCQHWNW